MATCGRGGALETNGASSLSLSLSLSLEKRGVDHKYTNNLTWENLLDDFC